MNRRFPGAKLIRSGQGSTLHRAGRVVINPWQSIENGCVHVVDGIICDVFRKKKCRKDAPGTMDHGPGTLMPGLVNAHVHLELSAMENRLNTCQGFGTWVRDLLEIREKTPESELKAAAKKAISGMLESGTVCAGEISTLGITREIMQASPLSGIWFREYLGSENQSASAFKDPSGHCHISLAGHAPHTSSPSLLQQLKQAAASRRLPFSIHAAESEDEAVFIRSGRGGWAAFLKERGIDFSSWPVPSKSPVTYLHNLNILDSGTLLVHLLDVSDTDLEWVAASGSVPVLCPRSNWNLHKRLPNLSRFLSMGLKPALGTDSLASTDSLSLFDEMAFVMKQYPDTKPEQIFAMATLYGADALGMGDRYGSLEKGRKGNFLYLPVQNSQLTFLLESILEK